MVIRRRMHPLASERQSKSNRANPASRRESCGDSSVFLAVGAHIGSRGDAEISLSRDEQIAVEARTMSGPD